jgi:hypothetical protein
MNSASAPGATQAGEVAASQTVGSWWRLGLGLWLGGCAGAIISVTFRLEFGIGWTALVPAVALLVPAAGLCRRRTLRVAGDRLLIEDGWLLRRAWAFGLDEATLEVVPTAGFTALVLHRRGVGVPLATWVSRRRAEALAAWLSSVAPAPLAVSEGEKPSGDR